MSEEVVEATPPETQTEPSEVVSEPPAAPEQPQPPEPKKRGRPPGAKDAVKRTRKPVVKLRVEPAVTDPPPATPQAPSLAPATPSAEPSQLTSLSLRPREPTPVYEPPSPRTLFRNHQEAVAREKRQKKQAEASMYTANWVAWSG
jgi:hypothetical protein